MSAISSELTRDTCVETALSLGTGTAAAFLRCGMACPGCAMAPFMSLSEAAAAYDLPVERLLNEIRRDLEGVREAER